MNHILSFHQVGKIVYRMKNDFYRWNFLAIAVRERPGGSRIGQSGEDLDFFIGDEAFNAKGKKKMRKFFFLVYIVFNY